jgi:hypothetical protein
MAFYFNILGKTTNSFVGSVDGICSHLSVAKEIQATQEVGIMSIPGCKKRFARWVIVGLWPKIMMELMSFDVP